MSGDPYTFGYWGYPRYQQYPQYFVSLQEKHRNYDKRIIKATNGYIVAWEAEFLGTISTEYRIFSTFEEMSIWLKETLE